MDNLGSNLHGVWFENDDMTVHEGVFKHNWGSYTGGGNYNGGTTYRFLGTFHYIPSGTRLPTPAPTVSIAPSVSFRPSPNTTSPSLSPSISSMPTGAVHSLATPSQGSKSAYVSSSCILFLS